MTRAIAIVLGVLFTLATAGCQTCYRGSCSCGTPQARARWARWPEPITFAVGSSELDDQAQRALDRVVARLRLRAIVFHVRVIGRGDQPELSIDDQELAQRRTAAVEEALRQRGLPDAVLAAPIDLQPIVAIDATSRTTSTRIATIDLLVVARVDSAASR